MAEEHFLLPEEEDISYMDLLGTALKIAFPKTALAYDLLEDPIKEGVSAATDPFGPRAQIEIDQSHVSSAKDELAYMENKLSESSEADKEYYQERVNRQKVWLDYRKQQRANTIKEKVSRFLRGTLGEELDYVDKRTDETFFKEYIMDSDDNVDFEATKDYLRGRDRFEKMYKARTDILRLGMKLPQRYDSMVPSEHRPTEEELEQITTKGAPAFVGQGGWNPSRAVWDFRDKDFYGVERHAEDDEARPYTHSPVRNLETVVGKHGSFWSQDMKPYNAPPPEGGEYGAYSDVWDFSIFDKMKIGDVTLGQALDELELYQAPQLYGRRYRKSQE